MSDPITQHEQLKSEQERITRELEKLEQDEAYKKAVIFKTDIQDVLAKHGKTEAELLQLCPKEHAQNTASKRG